MSVQPTTLSSLYSDLPRYNAVPSVEASWENYLGYFHAQVPAVQYFNIPINIHASFVSTLSTDIRHIVIRLDRHEDLLQEILETIKVIEVETRKPDAIHSMTDSAESELNDILHTIKEKRFPPPPSAEIDALLLRAMERKKNLVTPATPDGEELTTR